jgi:hypothetical protein
MLRRNCQFHQIGGGAADRFKRCREIPKHLLALPAAEDPETAMLHFVQRDGPTDRRAVGERGLTCRTRRRRPRSM